MKRSASLILTALGLMVFTAGCHLDMWEQGKVKPQSKSNFFSDNSGSRIEPAGTVNFGKPKLDTEFYTGYTTTGKLVTQIPGKIDEEYLKRGKERYIIFCAPCHGQLGDGNGMIAQRGFAVERPIPSYHTDRMREIAVGHIFTVITNGQGAMYPFGSRITAADRWKIAAYVRTLQKSQAMPAEKLTEEEKAKAALPPAEQMKAKADAHKEGAH